MRRALSCIVLVAACGETLPTGGPDSVPSTDAGSDAADGGGSDAASDADAPSDGGGPLPARPITCGTQTCVGTEVCCFSNTTATCTAPDESCAGALLGCLGQRDCAPGMQCCITAGPPVKSTCETTCAPDDAVLCWLGENDSTKVGCVDPKKCTGREMDNRYGLPNDPYGTCELP